MYRFEKKLVLGRLQNQRERPGSMSGSAPELIACQSKLHTKAKSDRTVEEGVKNEVELGFAESEGMS